MDRNNLLDGTSENIKKMLLNILVSFLLGFMIFIFGPAEIFFANISEFSFLYGEFAGYMALIFIATLLVLTAVLSVLPQKIHRIVSSLFLAISVAGYLQIMFLNKNLDLLGENPEGYHVSVQESVMNLIIWLVIFVAILIAAMRKNEMWKKTVIYASVFLISIQAVAMVSLLFTAPEDAYKRKQEDWLSGKDQYVVGGNKNIIVFVLDSFGSYHLSQMLEMYPDGADCLHDFIYYNNADSAYYATFPSVAHMLTGGEVDSSVTISEWCYNIWNNELTVDFYQDLMANNYKVNVFTPEPWILVYANGCEILRDRISNVTDEPQKIQVNTKLLLKTLTKMSCYRMAPNILKSQFYTNNLEYALIVGESENGIIYKNTDFYEKLKENGLQKDDSSNYVIFQHLNGLHEYQADADGNYKEGASAEETARGCMTILEGYLNELKRLGVYDDAAIIITSDHGRPENNENMQIVYFAKQPGEIHETSPVTNAPISHCDLVPTLAQMAGLTYEKYGKSIIDYKQNEQRERTLWVRTGDPDYDPNEVYYCYTYTGDNESLIMKLEEGPMAIEEINY